MAGGDGGEVQGHGGAGMQAEQAARDVLPGHPLARHIDDFLTDLANANKPRNTIRAYRGDLTAFAACHDGEAPGARRRRLLLSGTSTGRKRPATPGAQPAGSGGTPGRAR